MRSARQPPASGLAQRHGQLFFAAFGGVLAWAGHLLASYIAATYFCGRALTPWVLHALTLLAAGTALVALAFSARHLLSMRGQPQSARGSGRTLFLLSAGVLLGCLSLLAIVLSEFAFFIVGCR